jgi:hypothetical protein
MSTTSHLEEREKTLTEKVPRTTIGKAAYLVTTNRIAAGFICFLGFHMYLI